MATNISYYHFKNYYNRQAKKFDALSDYSSFLVSTETGKNFDVNDGVDTVITVGTSTQTDNINYAIVWDSSDNSIISRWYVIEAKKTRSGQYKVHLHRDLFADYRNVALSSPAFIEKAMLEVGDNAIFNEENMTFNQIKKSESLLKDSLGHGWIVGYMDVPSGTVNVTVPPKNKNVKATYATYTDFPDYDISTIVDKDGTVMHTGNYTKMFYQPQVYCTRAHNNAGDLTFLYESFGTTTYTYGPVIFPYISNLVLKYSADETKVRVNNAINDNYQALQNSLTGRNLSEELDTFYSINSKIYKVDRIESTSITESDIAITSGTTFDLLDESVSPIFNGSANEYSFKRTGDVAVGRLVLQEVTSDTLSCQFPATISTLSDAPYAMWAIPFGGKVKIGGVNKFLSREKALNIASNIVRSLTSQVCYDAQILPYCPRRDLINNGEFVLSGSEHSDFEYIKDGNNNIVSAIVFCKSSSFNFIISKSYDVSTDPIEFKVNNLTRFLRICSPNYNGIYEITPEKAGGILGFNVFCAYRPFNPYIQIQPNFGRLYGGNFMDARGLICSGDFSIPQATDAWNSYELNNKNYQNSFNREVQSIEFVNKLQRKMDIVNAITGTGSAGVSGAYTGFMAGGAYGAIGGAAVGVAGGAITGAMDVEMKESLRNEALDLKKDLFGFQMQNIKALPQSLTKVSAISPVNKIFPFIELYDASDVEKNALKSKIEYNGMTVGRIGNISEFLRESETFMKGQFIRLEISEDFHAANALAEEFTKGVYI